MPSAPQRTILLFAGSALIPPPPAHASAHTPRAGGPARCRQLGLGSLEVGHGVDVEPRRAGNVDRTHGAALGQPADAGAECRVGLGDGGVQRGEQRWIADEQAGVERVVSAELLADCRDAISGEPNLCRFRGQVWIGERRVDGEQPLTRLRRRAEQPREHRCVEQVVSRQKREAPIPESFRAQREPTARSPAASRDCRESSRRAPAGTLASTRARNVRAR